jgi:LysR substrate binding domain
MSGRPFAQKLRKPGLVLDFLVQNSERDIVGPVVFSGRHIADRRVAAVRAPLGLHQDLQHGFDVGGILGKIGRRTGRNIVKGVRAVGELATQLVEAGHQRLKMVPVFDARIPGDFLQPLAFQADQVNVQDGVIVIGGEFRGGVSDQHVQQLVHVHARFFNDFLDGADLAAEVLLKEQMVLVAPANSPVRQQRKGRVSMGEIDGLRLLLLKDGHCFRDAILEICKKTHMNLEVAFEGGQFDTLVGMVGAGFGVTLLPQMARSHYSDAGVKFLEFKPPKLQRTVGWVRLKDKMLNPGARAFVEVLKKSPATLRLS